MDRTGSRKQKIKDIVYITASITIIILLVIGIILTKNYVFPYHFVAKDIFWLTLPYIIVIFLVVQIFCVRIVGKVRKHFVSFTAIAISSFVSFQCAFISISLFHAFPLGGSITLLDKITSGVYWPAGLVWANYGGKIEWFFPDGNPIIFIFLATIFLTAFEYFWLRKRTEKKKALFLIIFISSFILCTAVSIFMKINY